MMFLISVPVFLSFQLDCIAQGTPQGGQEIKDPLIIIPLCSLLDILIVGFIIYNKIGEGVEKHTYQKTISDDIREIKNTVKSI